MNRIDLGGPRGRVPGASGIVMWALAGLVAVAVVAVGVALLATASPGFLGGYEGLKKNYTAMESSGHKGLKCNQCHTDERGEVAYRAALVGDFYRGLFGDPERPTFVRLTKPGRRACLACHEHDWSEDGRRTAQLPHPAHLRVADETRDCVTCHKWTAHEEEYMEEHKKMPFSSVCASFGCHVGTKSRDECGTCHHALQDGKGSWRLTHRKTVQRSGPNACLESCHDAGQCRECHTTGKRPKFPATGANAGLKAVERSHSKPNWIDRHGALALKDEAKCIACHVSVGECEDCHALRPAFHGLKTTWLHRHKGFAKDKRRCLACHEMQWCEECHDQFKEMR